MKEIEKVVLIGKACQNLKGIVVEVKAGCVWVEMDAFENYIRELGITEINHEWYDKYDKQWFYLDNIMIYTIYHENEDGYVPEPAPNDDAINVLAKSINEVKDDEQ